jgi:hypothetical protein
VLDYLIPPDGQPVPPDTTADDLWAEQIVLRASRLPVAGQTSRDPDGHAVRFVADGKEVLR